MKRVLDEAPAGITVTDPTQPDNPIVYANDKFRELTGYSDEDIVGQNCRFLQGPDTDSEAVAEMRDAIDAAEDVSVELQNYRKDGTPFWNRVAITPVWDEHGSVINYVGFQQDITERKQLEQEQQNRVRQQEVVAELGRKALEKNELHVLLENAVELVAETLDTDYCKVLELDSEEEKLHLREGVGWDEGIAGNATVSAVEQESQAAYTLEKRGPVVVEDLDTDGRFSGPTLLTDHDVKSGISIVIGSFKNPWGILGTHDREQRAFSEDEVTFVKSVANILATTINRHHDRQELQRQRKELATLVNLNTIVHETTESVIGKSTREEIEQAVCDGVAASASYEFAWVAEIDSQADRLDLRASAGEARGEAIPRSIETDGPHPRGPAATAIHEQEPQVVHNSTDTATGPWREAIGGPAFQSFAMIPIVHEETVYGVLAVYADRPDAFMRPEKTVISRLGEVVGHAIAAVERKRALVSEEIVELTFQVRNVFEELPNAPNGTITFDEIIPAKDDAFLIYGTATADARAGMENLTDTCPVWESISFQEETGESSFELKLSNHPVLSTLISLGGTHEGSMIEDGDYRLTVQLAPSADIRRLIDTIQESYEGVEMVTRRQTTRQTGHSDAIHGGISELLTDRQQSAIRAAYHAGMFEWPRQNTAQDVADSLDIAPSTFHHHLRKAEQKIVGSVLSAK
jgi:PAS domain S-box-containing protein